VWSTPFFFAWFAGVSPVRSGVRVPPSCSLFSVGGPPLFLPCPGTCAGRARLPRRSLGGGGSLLARRQLIGVAPATLPDRWEAFPKPAKIAAGRGGSPLPDARPVHPAVIRHGNSRWIRTPRKDPRLAPTFHASRFTPHVSRFPFHGSRFTVPASRIICQSSLRLLRVCYAFCYGSKVSKPLILLVCYDCYGFLPQGHPSPALRVSRITFHVSRFTHHT